jgi:hydroxymethylglutaryl-CoA lyase
MREQVIVREVGLRDGLQLVRNALPTERKIDWLRQEYDAGVRDIEVTSFVPPKTFPIFADALALATAALRLPGLRQSALAPNVKGFLLAVEAQVPQVNYVISASEAHSQANVRRSIEEAVVEFSQISKLRDARRPDINTKLSVGIGTSFGCSISGAVPQETVIDLADRLIGLGADEIMIADTVGYGNPAQVQRMFKTALERFPGVQLSAHFHDTRGLGLANVAAAVEVGIRRFDACLGSLGGCPHAPGATGNVNFEDTIFMLEAMGFSTGIDLSRILTLRRQVEDWLPGERFGGAIFSAGIPKGFPDLDGRN